MSREQANTFRKHRDAEDAQGNLAWAARLSQKALRASPEAMQRIEVEHEFELADTEKVIWRLLKLPRKYMDLENCGLQPSDKMRGFLRGLVAADVVDIVDASEAKALIPAEIKRVKAELAGKQIEKPREPLRGRVYRPSLDGPPPAAAQPEPVAAPASSSSMPAPPTSGSFKSPPVSSPSNTSSPLHRVPTAPKGVPGPAALSDDDRAFRDEILRAYTAMGKQNHYEFLGVQRPANDASVRQAYMRLAREYHPDRAAGPAFADDDTFKSKVDALFKRLGEAQQALSTEEGRQTYERTLEALGTGGTQAADGKRQRRPLEAQNAFKMGEVMFKKKDFPAAEAHYRQAALFDDQDPKILTALATCIWMNPDHDEKVRTAEARKRLTDILNTFKFPDASYKLGLLLRKAGEEAAAQRHFAIANKLDPNHVDAAREVRLANMRKSAAEEEKKSTQGAAGLINKLLKK